MGGDDELGVLIHQRVNLTQKRQQPGGRQSRLRLVQQVEPVSTKAVLHQGEEALPVRLLVEGHTAVAVDNAAAKGGALVHVVDVGGHVVKALRPEEKPILGVADP